MRAPETRRPARIVMALQSDESTWASLEHAAAMAAALHAELKATFLEDLDVLAAASLPVTRSIAFRTGRIGTLEPGQVEAHYRALAARARARVAALCRERALAWSFEIAGREPVPQPVPEPKAAQPKTEPSRPELLLLDRGALRRRQNLRALLQLATRYDTVGVWDMTMDRPVHLILVYREEAESLTVAGELARALGLSLDIVMPDSDGKPGEPLAQPVRQWLAEQGLSGTVHEFVPDDPDRHAGLLGLTRTPGALVIYDRRDMIAMLDEGPRPAAGA